MREWRITCDNGAGPDSNPQCGSGMASISSSLTNVSQGKVKIENI